MKIRKLHLKNIGVFDDETIEFQKCPEDKAEIHIFTGQNGSGKTTILQALATLFCQSILENSTDGELHGAFELGKNKFSKKLRNFSDAHIGFEVEHQSKVREYKFMVSLWGNVGRMWSSFEIDKNNPIDISINKYSFFSNTDQKTNPVQGWKQESFEFAVFAYSGYRRIKDEQIKVGEEIEEHPLYQSLNFIKDENSKLTANQWLGQNLLNSALSKAKNELNDSEVFTEKVKNLEKVINEIIVSETQDDKIKFEMQSATKLVLIKNNEELDFDVLPDGLKSLISWIGDLLMRLDSLKWENDVPIFDREIILFLDEIEVHLHPAWQRKVLPVVQKLFKNAQIFVSTHSPFVVNSVDDAWVYKLQLENGKAKVADIVKSENSYSITQVLREIFDIDKLFGEDVRNKLNELERLRDKILSNGSSEKDEEDLLKIARSLAKEPSDRIKQIVRGELQQLSEIKGKNFSI
jgi:predicted ATP-binding protein involved in virulence